jgi:NDP-sugar pyrophosphorylase family protein
MGERLRPLSNETPKPMLPLGGRPLIHYPLAMLKRAGITEVAINVHHLAGKIQEGLGNGSRLGMSITYAPEPVLLGTGGPLNGLREYLCGDTFVIANSDGILDLDLAAMVAVHRQRAALATIALYKPANLDYYSLIEIDADERIRRMRL